MTAQSQPTQNPKDDAMSTGSMTHRWMSRDELEQDRIVQSPEMAAFVNDTVSGVRTLYDRIDMMRAGGESIGWNIQPNGLITTSFMLDAEYRHTSPHFGNMIDKWGCTAYLDFFEFKLGDEWLTWDALKARFNDS